MNLNQSQVITLAALLHDVGKFFERTSPTDQIPEWSNYKYSHAYWTSRFFEDYQNLFPFNINQSLTDDPLDNLKGIAAYHHNPGTNYQRIISFADQLAAGAERELSQEDYVEGERKRKILLEQIFNQINLTSDPYDRKFYYDLNLFDPLTDKIFPHQCKLEQDQTENYKKLFNEFIEGLEKIKTFKFFDQYLEALISLMERTMWAVPATTKRGDLPDVSLFDHSKVSAAIANCLFQYFNANGFQLNVLPDSEKLFLFIAGDLSGIQNYIFSLNNINVSGTAKILRARSFYLQNLSFQVVRYILHKINLPLINEIIDAGGRFILIAPNLPELKNTLSNIKTEVESFCRIRFGGILSINISYDVDASKNDLMRSNFYKIILRISESLENSKRKKFSSILSKNDNWIIDRFKFGEVSDPFNLENYKDHGACNVCGKLPATINKDNDWICIFCNSEIDIGKKLTRVTAFAYPSLSEKPFSQIADDFYIYDDEELKENLSRQLDNGYLIQCVNASQVNKYFLPCKILATNVPVWKKNQKLTFDLVKEENEVFITDSPKTFYHLAMQGLIKEKNENGKPMLGILKADVDRLGYIFSEGIKESASISKFAFLSRMLNAFFSGFVTGLIKTKFTEIYTVYSGGDDLFLIGEWKEIFEFARELHLKFTEFCGYNPSITISAGIALIDPKFPINKGALKAEEYLEDAKGKGRNRIHIFETTIEWNKLPEIMKLAEFLDTRLNDEKSSINNSFIYRLLDYHFMAMKHFEKNEIEGLKYLSHLHYDIGRNILKGKADKVTDNVDYNTLIKLALPSEDSYFLIRNLKIPIFYTIYKNRGKKIKKQNKEN